MIFDGNDIFTWSAQTGATLIPDPLRKAAANSPAVNANTGVTATQTVLSDALFVGGGGIGYVNQLNAQVRYQDTKNTSGSNSLQFVLQESADNTTWTDRVVSDTLTLTATAQAGMANLQFQSQAKYLRLRVVFAGSGSGATATINGAALTPTGI